MIGDESAEFFLLHNDAASRVASDLALTNPLDSCATDARSLGAFNTGLSLYGGKPVTVLVSKRSLRRENAAITCRLASGDLPAGSFFKLRDGLYMTSPELVFLRAASRLPIGALVALGEDLCARYYLKLPESDIKRRAGFILLPERLNSYVGDVAGLRGSKKARIALKYIVGNSGSPEETKSWVLFTLPMRYGGFGLEFTGMNYRVAPGRYASLVGKSWYELDIVAEHLHLAFEYDGGESHPDASADKRRRNDLKVLGWDVYPIDAFVLYDPKQTIVTAKQLAKLMGKRLRFDEGWPARYAALRKSLGLPA